VDAEAIGMAKRLLEGVHARTETLATAMFEGVNFKGDFLKQRITRELFAKEQYLPSDVIDRDSIRGWQQSGSLDTFARAKVRTQQLLSEYQRPQMDPAKEKELVGMVENLARQAGMDALPTLD
jgi:trimethylamine--corrinoid protein Co-methyltransferase